MRRLQAHVKRALLCRRFTIGGVHSTAIPQGLQAFSLPDSSETVEAIAEAYVNMDMATMRRFHELVLGAMSTSPGASAPQYEEALLRGMNGGGGGGGGLRSAGSAINSSMQTETTAAEKVVPAKKAVEKSTFDVAIKNYPAANKVKLIKELRAVSGLPLQEAKAAVEKCPGVVVKTMARADAEKLKALLEGHGAEVELL